MLMMEKSSHTHTFEKTLFILFLTNFLYFVCVSVHSATLPLVSLRAALSFRQSRKEEGESDMFVLFVVCPTSL